MGGGGGGEAASESSGVMAGYAQQAGEAERGYLMQALGLTNEQFNAGMGELNNYYAKSQYPLAPYSFGGLNAYDLYQQSAGVPTLPGGSFQLQQALGRNKEYKDALGAYENAKGSVGGIAGQLNSFIDDWQAQRWNPAFAGVAGNIGTSNRYDFDPNDPALTYQVARQVLQDIETAKGNVAQGADANYATAFSKNEAQIKDLVRQYEAAQAAIAKGAPVNSLTPEQQQLVKGYDDGTLSQSAKYDKTAALGNFYDSPLAMALFGQQDPNKSPLENFKTSPDYEFRREEGLRDLEKRASSRGLLESGALVREMDNFNSGLASGEWNNYAGRITNTFGNYQGALSNLAGMGATTNALLSQNALNQGNNLANYRSNYAQQGSNIYGALGASAGNSLLAQGNAIGSGMINSYNMNQAQQGQQAQGLGALSGLFSSFNKKPGTTGGTTSGGASSGGFNGGGALSGAASGASAGMAFGPWGAAIGGVAGGLFGGFS